MVRNGRPSVSKMGGCRRVGVDGGLGGGGLLLHPELGANALRPPGLPGGGLGCEVLRDVAADVWIGAWIPSLGTGRRHGVVRGDGVVDVEGHLPPGIEDDLLVGVVGVQRGDDALDRVVEQDRADTDAHAELEAVRVAEERLVLADGFALVVVDGPAAAHPSGADVAGGHLGLPVCADDDLAIAVPARCRAGLGLDLLLDFPSEAVGVGEGVLHLGLRGRLGRHAWVSRASV